MEAREFNEEQLTNVKEVLFGKQKQASVINASVVKIVARGLVDVKGESCLNVQAEIVTAIKDYLQYCVDGGQVNETLVMLTAGEESLALIKEPGPKTVYAEPLSPESPKYNFRVVKLGETPNIDNSYEAPAKPAGYPEKPAGPQIGGKEFEDMSFRAKAETLKNQILPTVSSACLSDCGGDEYMACLACSKEYFNYKFMTGEL